jgi:hypothetical protein
MRWQIYFDYGESLALGALPLVVPNLVVVFIMAMLSGFVGFDGGIGS